MFSANGAYLCLCSLSSAPCARTGARRVNHAPDSRSCWSFLSVAEGYSNPAARARRCAKEVWRGFTAHRAQSRHPASYGGPVTQVIRILDDMELEKQDEHSGHFDAGGQPPAGQHGASKNVDIAKKRESGTDAITQPRQDI